MGIVELLLISVGLSLDVAVVHICVGAGFSRPHRKDSLLLALMFSGVELAALLLGNGAAHLIKPGDVWGEKLTSATNKWEVFSILIFFGLAVYMFYKAWNDEPVFERRRDEINWKRMWMLAIITSIDALLAGIGIGFWSVEIFDQALVLVPVTIIQVFLGIYTGYRLGCEHNRKAYGLGGLLLLISGIDVAITYIVAM